jgi:DNA-binding MarR family transcriptional regulator
MTEDARLASLFARLVRVQVELFDRVDARLKNETGMMLIALLPMRVVAGRPGCRVQDLADGLGISVGGASKSADRLVASGWVRRAGNPGDRRSSVLELTAEGERVLALGEKIVADEMRSRVLAPLGSAGLEAFAAALDRLDPTADAG